MAKEKSKGRTIKVDGDALAKSGGSRGSDRIPEGDYKAKIAKIIDKPSQNDDPMLTITYEVSEGKYKGKKVVDRIVLKESVLWKLRQVLDAVGKEAPKKVFSLNIDKLIGEEVCITTVDGDPYKGRIKSEIAEVQSVDAYDDTDADDEDDDDDDDDDELEDVDLDDEL